MAGREIVFAVEASPDGGYEARALGESIFTEADTLPEVKAMVREAMDCHFEDSDRPAVIRLVGIGPSETGAAGVDVHR